MEYQYKFSVVIPVYNVYGYLRETLDSVIQQDIGFEENIQVILVNDGSPDRSEEICLEYQKRYPDNIVYLKQENQGVSAARNHAISYIRIRSIWSPVPRNFLRRGMSITGCGLNMKMAAASLMYWISIIISRCMSLLLL